MAGDIKQHRSNCKFDRGNVMVGWSVSSHQVQVDGDVALVGSGQHGRQAQHRQPERTAHVHNEWSVSLAVGGEGYSLSPAESAVDKFTAQ